MTESHGRNGEWPRRNVFRSLEASIEIAEDQYVDLPDEIDNESFEFAQRIAIDLVNARQELLGPRTASVRAGQSHQQLNLENPLVRHAAEVEVARHAIARAQGALDRYFKVTPVVTRRELPQRARAYIGEVVQTFAFGFDAACIALCRATFEVTVKDALVNGSDEWTDARIRREKPGAKVLLNEAVRAGIVRSSRANADKLIEKGDTVMHQFVYESRVSQQTALDSIEQLVAVLVEVIGADQTDATD